MQTSINGVLYSNTITPTTKRHHLFTFNDSGTSNMAQANPDEIAVTRLFVYLKNTLDFDNLEDELFAKKIV